MLTLDSVGFRWVYIYIYYIYIYIPGRTTLGGCGDEEFWIRGVDSNVLLSETLEGGFADGSFNLDMGDLLLLYNLLNTVETDDTTRRSRSPGHISQSIATEGYMDTDTNPNKHIRP